MLNSFDKRKLDILKKQDKSKKGAIDERIRELVDVINSREDFYTTSSCSGRILLFQSAESGKKNESRWLFVSHEKVTLNKIKACLKNPEGDIWLKQEGMILHICARTLEDAERLLEICRTAGFKRAGIINFGKRIILEVFSNERIDAIICKNRRIVVDDSYLQILIDEANKKLEKNWGNLEKMGQIISNKL